MIIIAHYLLAVIHYDSNSKQYAQSNAWGVVNINFLLIRTINFSTWPMGFR